MLEQISERIYVAPGGVNVGVIFASDGRAILIDSGLNDTTARKVIRWLADIDRSISAIVTTHGHADTLEETRSLSRGPAREYGRRSGTRQFYVIRSSSQLSYSREPTRRIRYGEDFYWRNLRPWITSMTRGHSKFPASTCRRSL